MKALHRCELVLVSVLLVACAPTTPAPGSPAVNARSATVAVPADRTTWKYTVEGELLVLTAYSKFWKRNVKISIGTLTADRPKLEVTDQCLWALGDYLTKFSDMEGTQEFWEAETAALGRVESACKGQYLSIGWSVSPTSEAKGFHLQDGELSLLL